MRKDLLVLLMGLCLLALLSGCGGEAASGPEAKVAVPERQETGEEAAVPEGFPKEPEVLLPAGDVTGAAAPPQLEGDDEDELADDWKRRLAGTWDDAAEDRTLALSATGGGAWQIDGDYYQITWTVRASEEQEDGYVLIVHEEGASGSVSYEFAMEGEDSLELLTEDGQRWSMNRRQTG